MYKSTWRKTPTDKKYGTLNRFRRQTQWLSKPRAWMKKCHRGIIFMLLFVIGLSTTVYFMANSIHTPRFYSVWKMSVITGSSPKEHSNASSIANILLTPVPDSNSVNMQKQKHNPEKNTNKNYMNDEVEKEFRKQWFRMQKYRVDWKRILAPCANNTVLGEPLPGWGKENETSLKESYVEYMKVRPVGQFSRFFIRTRTAGGRNKTIGGDFWKVILFGPATVAATVFDHGNGSYEAIALIVDPGKYSLVAVVERSLCEGMKDPPPEFYTRLAIAMRRRVNPSKQEKEPGCCLNGRLQQKVQITVLPSKDNVEKRIHAVLESNCSRSCSFIWSGLGRWLGEKWTPFVSSDNHPLYSLSEKTQTKDTIFIYGDSITTHFAKTLYYHRKAYNVCDHVWKRCENDFFHLYPTKSKIHPNALNEFRSNIQYNELENYGNSSEEFKPKIILDSIKEVLLLPGMKSSSSLFLLNFNAHHARMVTFAQFKDFIGNLTYLLKNRAKLFKSKANVVWRTATALNYRGIFNRYWSSKYLTSDRALLYGAYALSEICKSGIDVLDLYPMSIATPLARDRVHFKAETFFKAMDALTWHSLFGVYSRTKKMCLVP